MRARVLGAVGVEGLDGSLGGRRERTVLAVLALHAGRQVTEDVLAFALWEDDPPRTATRTVQSSIARLRREVGDAIESVPGGGYRWMGDVDVAQSEQLVAEARALVDRNDVREAAGLYDQALALWADRPLADVGSSSWIDSQVRRLEELRRTIADERADARIASGGAGELVPELEVAVDEAPLRERRWAQLITALYRAGRQADALRAYQRLRAVLADELGIEPSPALQSLDAQVINQTLPITGALPGDAPSARAGTTGDPIRTEQPVDQDGLGSPPDTVMEVRDADGLRVMRIEPPLVAIGRSEQNDIVLAADGEVSRRHAVLEHIAGGWVLNDLGSRNGSLVNGVVASGRCSLQPGDEIRIGRARLVLRSESSPATGDETVAADGSRT